MFYFTLCFTFLQDKPNQTPNTYPCDAETCARSRNAGVDDINKHTWTHLFKFALYDNFTTTLRHSSVRIWSVSVRGRPGRWNQGQVENKCKRFISAEGSTKGSGTRYQRTEASFADMWSFVRLATENVTGKFFSRPNWLNKKKPLSE